MTDPVDEWKRDALASVGVAAPSRPRLALRVRLGFILVVLLAGAPFGVTGWAAALVTFLSVSLVQEVPTLLAARVTRRGARVVLSASGSEVEIKGPPFARLTLAALATCGALANLGVALALAHLLRRDVLAGSAATFLAAAAFVHGFWGVGQLLPLPPFRAGRAVARRLRPPGRFVFATFSFVGMGAVGLWTLHAPGLPAHFFLFVLVVMASTSVLRDAFNELRDDQSGVAVMATSAANLLRQDQPVRAAQLANQALASATVERNRVPHWQALAWAAIANRDPFMAHGALLRLPADSRDLHLVAAYLACCRRFDEAIALLQEARAHGHRARETSKLLVDLLFQVGRLLEARALAQADRELLGPDDVRVIEAALASVEEAPRHLESNQEG